MPPLPADDSMPPSEKTDNVDDQKESQNCRVYVGNLAWGVRSEELKMHMQTVGEVLRAYVFEDSIGRSKGCGIVIYQDQDAAQIAIKELTDSLLQDRPIFVREDREESVIKGNMSRGISGRGRRVNPNPRVYSGGRSSVPTATGCMVHVGNLPWRINWRDLRMMFEECGDVIRADVLEHPDGKSRGCGTVIYSSPEGAKKAVETYHNSDCDGRHITVKIQSN